MTSREVDDPGRSAGPRPASWGDPGPAPTARRAETAGRRLNIGGGRDPGREVGRPGRAGSRGTFAGPGRAKRPTRGRPLRGGRPRSRHPSARRTIRRPPPTRRRGNGDGSGSDRWSATGPRPEGSPHPPRPRSGAMSARPGGPMARRSSRWRPGLQHRPCSLRRPSGAGGPGRDNATDPFNLTYPADPINVASRIVEPSRGKTPDVGVSEAPARGRGLRVLRSPRS